MDQQEAPGLVAEPRTLLARLHGVDPVRPGGAGPATPETLVAVLAALGVDASTQAAVTGSLAALLDAAVSRLLPPVTTCLRPEPLLVRRPIRPDLPAAARAALRTGRPLGGTATTAGPLAARLLLAAGRTVPLARVYRDTETLAGTGTAARWRPRPFEAAPGEVPLRSLGEGLLEALGAEVGWDGFAVPADVPAGWHLLEVAGPDGRTERAPVLVAARPPVPAERAWGFMSQLYSVRSRGSWGMGDLRDLAELARWSAALGAGFTLVNPVHAAEPCPPIQPSPYLPVSRRFASPLYLRVEDVPEFAGLDGPARTRALALAAELKARDTTLDALDRDAVWTAKERALAAVHRLAPPPARKEAYERYRANEGEELVTYATWCALAERHGSDWRTWPAGLRDPAAPAVARARTELAERVEFHTWLQWQLDGQLHEAHRTARAAGMPIGVVHDLAVGVHPGGADTWAHQDLIATGMSVGAPPDAFNQRGQDWGQPPWHPGRLAEAGYAPLRELFAATLRHAGGLRLDHAMQVSRLWWVPVGGPPAAGAYVRYGAELLTALAHEAAVAGALVIGEDLGTVDPHVRDDLRDHHVLGTSLLWFEREGDGPRPPAHWRALSLATVGSHDLPPITGFLHGDHVALRQRLDLLTRPAAAEYADHAGQLAQWKALLAAEGLLTASDPADTDLVAALHALLAATPALLVGISLADAVGERRTQNQPGTVDEYPNWRVPLADAAGRPVLLDDLPATVIAAALRPVLGLRGLSS